MQKFVFFIALSTYFQSIQGATTSDITDECIHSMCGVNCFKQPNCDDEDWNKVYKGPFFIDVSFWEESGRPTLPLDDPARDSAFESCACNYKCATEAIAGYMRKNAVDCDTNGIIDCEDYIFIYQFGRTSCVNKLMTSYWEGGTVLDY